MVPFVTGDVNPAALDDLVRLCVVARPAPPPPAGTEGVPGATADDSTGGACSTAPAQAKAAKMALAMTARRACPGHDTSAGGPGVGHHRQGRGPALRGRAGSRRSCAAGLGARLGGPSLPLDIGFSESVPAGIRNAVTLRDQHCRWAGGCNQPASACEVHHVRHKKNGGKTSTKDCVLLCFFHHQIVIHK